jgi:hypothetical protein
MLIKDEVSNARDEPVHLLDKERRTAVAAAPDCEALYRVIREDFWISTPCLSTLRPGDLPTFATSAVAGSSIANCLVLDLVRVSMPLNGVRLRRSAQIDQGELPHAICRKA